MKKTIGVGVIGLGGRGLYLAGLYDRASQGDFELRALCDINPKLLDKAGRQYGERVVYYADLQEMLRDPGVDAVIVATNDPHHVAPALAALKAGKHVLVEKPLCQHIEEAQLLVQAAQAAPGIFLIGFELRSCSLFIEMKRLLDEGRIEDVKIGHCFDNVSVGGNFYFHNPYRQKEFYKTLLLQKATHSLDLLNWFMGSEPVKVYGIGGMDFFGGRAAPELQCSTCPAAPECPYEINPQRFQLDYGAEVEVPDNCVWSTEMNLNDNSELCISYVNGGKATFHECHFTPEYNREFWLVGTKGKMYGHYNNEGNFLIRIEYSHAKGRRTEVWQPPPAGGSHGGGDEGLRNEFYRRIVENDRADEALKSAYYSTALAICAETSIETGMAESIPPLDPGPVH